jgi:hypothetical protein
MIIAAAPEDPRVAVTLFSTGSWSDRRTDAISRMETNERARCASSDIMLVSVMAM